MKKFLKSIGKLISRHKLLFTICTLAFIIIVIMTYIFFNLFIGGADKYGARLNGIEEHEITKSQKKDVVSFLEEKSEVTSASVRIQGKIIYIHIECNRDTSLDRAKEIATESLTKFEDDDKSFYDIAYSLTQVKVEDEEDIGFVVTGTKSNKLDNISWIKS